MSYFFTLEYSNLALTKEATELLFAANQIKNPYQYDKIEKALIETYPQFDFEWIGHDTPVVVNVNYGYAKEMFAANRVGSEQDRFQALCKMLENSVDDFTGSATLIDEHDSRFTVTA